MSTAVAWSATANRMRCLAAVITSAGRLCRETAVGVAIAEFTLDGQKAGVDSSVSDVAGDFFHAKDVATEVHSIVHSGPEVGVLAFTWRRSPS